MVRKLFQESSGEIYGFNFISVEELNSLHSCHSSLITNKLLMTVVTDIIPSTCNAMGEKHLPCGVISAA